MRESTDKNPNFEAARDHFKAAHESLRESMESFLPKGYVEHKRAARKEFLLAMRSLIDAAIEKTDVKEEKSA